MVQPLAISVISPMDMSIACDAERPSLSDTRLLYNIKADLMVVQVSMWFPFTLCMQYAGCVSSRWGVDMAVGSWQVAEQCRTCAVHSLIPPCPGNYAYCALLNLSG
ncbi:unnamed protein product [Leuciscus chuanchicus]